MTKQEAKAILEEYLALDSDIHNEFVDAMRVAIDALMEESIAKEGGE